MKYKWYVVHVYSGSEKRVKDTIEDQVNAKKMNEYIDYMCAYGPMILGYDNEVIEQAVRDQLAKADTCTLASPVMVDLAEMFVDLIPWADWATFAKNGADATNMAVLIARTHTGRRKLIAIEGGYHGSSPWMQARGRAGISERDHHELIRIPWNDLPALQLALLGEVMESLECVYHSLEFISRSPGSSGSRESSGMSCNWNPPFGELQ